MTKLIGGSPSQVPTNSQLSRSAFIEPEDLPVSQSVATELEGKESNIAPGTPDQYWSGDKAWTDFREAVLNTSTGYPEIRPVFNANFMMAGQLDPRITFARPGKSWRIVNGVIREYDVNEPVLTPEGWSLRPAETNATYPSAYRDFSFKRSSTYSTAPSIVAPDLTSGVGKLTEDTATDERYGDFYTGSVSDAETFTVFVKSSGRTKIQLSIQSGVSGTKARANFDLSTGTATATIGGGKITQLSGGWFRCDIWGSVVGGSSWFCRIRLLGDNGDVTYTGDGVSGVYFWGIIRNAGDPIPYIPTTSGAVTRAADNASIQGADFAEIWNPQEGAMIFDTSGVAFYGYPQVFQLMGANLQIYQYAGDQVYRVVGSGIPDTGIGCSGPGRFSIGLGWAGTAAKIVVNGVPTVETTIPDLSPTEGIYLTAPSGGDQGARQNYRLRIFNHRPSDAQMEALTS